MGRIQARFSHTGGQTWLAHAFCAAPLKIAKTFALEGGQVGVCVMDCSPGLLASDCYDLEWHLEENAKVSITNQSFTKVHPSREQPCHQRQSIRLERGTYLEWMPEPTMLYRDAALHAECDVHLEPDATLLFCDIVCAGRIGRDEAFQFALYENRLRVHCGDELIYCHQQRLCPEEQEMRAPGVFEDCTHWGSFFVFSPSADAELRDALREALEEFPQLISGASLTHRHGIVASMLGHRAWDLQEAARRLRDVARQFDKCDLTRS